MSLCSSPTRERRQVCVTEVVCRFGGVVGTLVFGGGGGVVVAQGAVAPVSDATADRFCALSDASTPSVYVVPHWRPAKSPVVPVVVPTFEPFR